MDLQITVEDSKAKQLVAFLKQLDFVWIEKSTATQKALKKKETKTQITTGDSFPFSGMCPDWEVEARELRKAGTEKRLKGWL
jgi:hypothetical protein